MEHEIDIEAWKRREHYHIFMKYEQPFFNITAEIDVTNLALVAKNQNVSIFLLLFYGALKSANQIDEFKYRIRGEKVILHDQIRGGCTILRENNTFGFGYFKYYSDFLKYQKKAKKAIKRAKSDKPLDPNHDKDDLFYSSVLPWINFSSIEHPKRQKTGDSIPKFVFGKITRRKKNYYMSLSVTGHHALMDGYHVGQFFEFYQKYCNTYAL